MNMGLIIFHGHILKRINSLEFKGRTVALTNQIDVITSITGDQAGFNAGTDK